MTCLTCPGKCPEPVTACAGLDETAAHRLDDHLQGGVDAERVGGGLESPPDGPLRHGESSADRLERHAVDQQAQDLEITLAGLPVSLRQGRAGPPLVSH